MCMDAIVRCGAHLLGCASHGRPCLRRSVPRRTHNRYHTRHGRDRGERSRGPGTSAADGSPPPSSKPLGPEPDSNSTIITAVRNHSANDKRFRCRCAKRGEREGGQRDSGGSSS